MEIVLLDFPKGLVLYWTRKANRYYVEVERMLQRFMLISNVSFNV